MSFEVSPLFGCVVAPAEQFAAQLMKLSQDFTPRYEMEKGSLALLDLSGLSHLFQNPHELGASIKASALNYGIEEPRIALATRLQAARRLALFRPGLSIALDEKTEVELLGALPIESLDLDDRTRHHGIPITSPARTLLDLAATLDHRPLRAATRRVAIHVPRIVHAQLHVDGA